MSDFDRWSAFREAEEGGWSDDPMDHGGATKYGISQNAYPGLNIANLTREQAGAIAKADYWDVVRGDEMPWPLSLVLADGAFHAGPSRAIGWLQAEVGAEIDGDFGEDTMDRARRVAALIGTQTLAEHVHLRRVSHLAKLIQGNASQVKFAGGWFARVVRLAFLMGG